VGGVVSEGLESILSTAKTTMRLLSARIGALGMLCLAGSPLVEAGGECAGTPFVNVTRPRAVEESAGVAVGPQIFDVALHPRGFVLMANNYGLLQFDGTSWRLLPLGHSAVALSVAVGPDGRMFAGGSMTFGEVVEDPGGKLIYQPVEPLLSAKDGKFSDVWQTLVAPSGTAYFRSRERIFVLNNGETRAIAPKGEFSAVGLAGGVLYANDTAEGIVALEGVNGVPVPGGDFFRNVHVTAIVEGRKGSLLVGTQDRGLFQFDLLQGKPGRVAAALAEFAGSEILSVRRLADGQIAVGTLRNGLVVLGADGRLRFRLDRDRGLPDNAVLTLQTSPGALWAGTSGGVARLLIPGPMENFGPREGLPGLVESMVRHRGAIYAASSEGVFRLTCKDKAFEAVPSLRKQAFALLSAGTLLAATADGIYEIDGATVRLVRPGGARGLVASRETDRVWAATRNGPVALRRKGGAWTVDSPVTLGPDEHGEALTNMEATSIGEDADGRLWIALATGRVVSGMPVRGNAALALTAPRTFGEAEGLSSGFAEVISLRDGIRIGTGAAILRPRGDSLAKDADLENALGPGRGAFRIRDGRDGGFWIASAKRPVRLVRNRSGGLVARNTSLLRTPAGSRILDFLEVSDTEVWIGTDDGAFRYDPTREAQEAVTTSAYVRRALSRETELYSGGPTDSLETPLPHLSPLRFEVASSSLDDPSRNRFRFRLDGQDTEWTPWTADTRKDYTNLGPGGYRFRVETRDVYGRVGKEAGLSFVVLTPWYRKPWAMGLGLVAAAALFFGALNLRTRALRKRQRELELIVDQKTRELREASFSDPLTGLRNRRYYAEVIESEASLACRPGSPALHMFLIDLDHFKQVNDTQGHAAGDQILRQTASRLKIAMRTSDLIFRWGGEEFLIVARGAGDLPRNEIANRIVRMIGTEPFDIGTGTPLHRTCSVGFATYPFYPENPTSVPLDAVIELADLSLYRAKHTGRNRAVGVSPQADAPAPGDVWKNQVLENLEKAAVSVEVLEGPPVQDP
jgi:diguanylate cyclase (GGDEF)-like protein